MSSEVKNSYHLVPVKLQAAKAPVFIEKQNKDWIYFGEKNDYPQYLIELYRRSVMHSTIIDAKQDFICGAGWMIDTKGMNTLEASQLAKWIEKPNDIEDFQELTKKIVLDLEIFNGCAIEVIYTKDAKGKAQLNHIPFENVRVSKDGKTYFYTSKWFKTNSNGTKTPNQNPREAEDWKEFKAFDPEKKGDKSQLFYYNCYGVGKDVYPLPNYLAGITAIETESRIDNFWLNFIKKGFAVSHMINFYNGVPTPEEQLKIKETIKDKLTGDDADEVIIINFASDKEHGSEVQTLTPSDFDKMYQQLNETVQTKILQRHRISNPAMVGIKTPGQLGGDKELKESIEFFQNTYAVPRQAIVEYIFDTLLAEENAKGRIKLKRLEPVGIDVTNDKVWGILTDDEKREKLGLPQLESAKKASNIADAINALSPLVATKVLESMSLDEIRSLIGLSPAPPGGIITRSEQTTQKNFSAEEFEMPLGVVKIFEKYGFERSKADIKQSRDFEFTSEEDLDASEALWQEKFDKEETPEGLPSGKVNLPPSKNTPKVKTEVAYSYEGPQDNKNRTFCAEMLRLDRLYTKADMRAINAEIRANDEFRSAFGGLSINVWLHRGGWYRKPGTDVSIPRCRHTWKQHLILKQ